jgi:hypothetical protein
VTAELRFPTAPGPENTKSCDTGQSLVVDGGNIIQEPHGIEL